MEDIFFHGDVLSKGYTFTPVDINSGNSNIRYVFDRCNSKSLVFGCMGEIVCNPCTATKTFS